jgi:hypothetical protein
VGRQDIQNADIDRIIFGKVGIIWIYEADEFWLRYCLIDCPPHILAREKEREWYKYYSNTMTDAVASLGRKKPLFDQIERNLVYSSNEFERRKG